MADMPGLVLAGATTALVLAAPATLPPMVALYAANAALRFSGEAAARAVAAEANDKLEAIKDAIIEVYNRLDTLNAYLQPAMLFDVSDDPEVTDICGLAEIVHRLNLDMSALQITINNLLPNEPTYGGLWEVRDNPGA